MRCRTARQLMERRLDGHLGPVESARLRRHLQRCADCRAIETALRRADRLLSQSPQAAPPPDLVPQVLEQLPESRRAIVPPAPVWVRASMVVTASLALLLAGVVVIGLLIGLSPEAQEWALIREGGRSAISSGWHSVRSLFGAWGHVLGALWQALRWPWLGIVLTLGVAAVAIWGWLWRRSAPRPARSWPRTPPNDEGRR